MKPFEFKVTVVTHTREQAEEVLRKLLTPAQVLGDPQDRAAMPFPYIVDIEGMPFHTDAEGRLVR